MALDPQTLFTAAKCYTCLGLSDAESLELALLSGLSASGITTPTDSVVLDYVSRLTVLSGGTAPSATFVSAMDVYVKGMRADGNWDKMIVVHILPNFFTPSSLAVPLLVGPSAFVNGPVGTNPFIVTDVTLAGLCPNAGNKFLSVGCTPAVMWSSASNIGFSSYASIYVGNGNWSTMGCTGGGNTLQFFEGTAGGNVEFDCLNNANDVALATPPGLGGFYTGNRIANNDSRLFFGNSTTAFAQIGATQTNVMTGTLVGLLPIWAMGTNNAGPLFNTSRTISYLAWHTGMTGTQAAKHFARVQTLRTSMGGGFV
jgi:hypothetical protein